MAVKKTVRSKQVLSKTTKTLKPNTRFKPGQWWNRWRALIFVGLFAVIGGTLLVLTRAQDQIAVACPTDAGAPITSGWGWRSSTQSYHAGIDIGVDFKPIYAAESGQVIYAGQDDGLHYGYQKTIDLRGGSGRVYRYGHLSGFNVSAGQGVQAGQLIGQSGDGNGTLPSHLHWEIRTDGGGAGINGTVDPTWAYQNCGNGAPSAGANNATSINNPGTDCHNYVLQYDPSRSYPCVNHLQTEINNYMAQFSFYNGAQISVDGVFGPGTKSAVQRIQSGNGADATGIVDHGTWCIFHPDLCGGGGSTAPTPAPTTPAPAGNRDPLGTVDDRDCTHIRGWSFDPDNSGASIQVHVYIDGVGYNTGNTAASRPDVNAAYGISGTHGFDYATPARWKDGQTHDVVVFGINTPSGNNPIIGGGKLGPCAAPAAPTTTPPTGTTTTTTPSSSGVAITGVASNRCVDVPGQNFSNGMYTQLWDCNGSPAQRWNFLSNGAIQTSNNKCLDVNGGSTANGAQVIIWDCHYQSNQQWTRNPDGTIRSRQTGKCLDATGYGTGNGTRLQMYDCVGGSNQKWR